MAVQTRLAKKRMMRPQRVKRKIPVNPKKKVMKKRVVRRKKVTKRKITKRRKVIKKKKVVKKRKVIKKRKVVKKRKVTKKKKVVKKRKVVNKSVKIVEACKPTACTFQFNARGDDAPYFKSAIVSRNPLFCDIPSYVIKALGHMLSASYELDRMLHDNKHMSHCDIINSLLPMSCMKGWRLTKFLGEGIAGYVFGSRHRNTHETGALKIQVAEKGHTMMDEVNTHKKFAAVGLSPKIHSYCSTKKFGKEIFVLNMARIDTVLDHWLRTSRPNSVIDTLVERIFEMIDVMDKNNLTHGDLHSDNIGFVFKRKGSPGKIQILDHGFATTKFSFPEIEIVQFIRTLHKVFSPRVHARTSTYLRDRCISEAKRIYGLRIPKGLNSLDSEFSRLRNKLKRKLANSK